MKKPKSKRDRGEDVPVIGDVDDWEPEVVKALLEVPARGKVTFYIDSAGGSVYGALAAVTLLRHRQLEATGIVLGECSSATLLLFAACRKRLVTPYCTLMFHKMRWQSDKRVGAGEAHLWAKHFEELEETIDAFQARLFGAAEEKLREWTREGRYVTGPQLVAAGLAELLEV
jgi:ATP-dependent protease ClpP protease subunit